MNTITYEYKDFEEVFIEDISKKALEFTKEAVMMSHEYCSKQIEYMLSDVTLVRIDGEYDFVELADCATNNRNVSTFVESIFEKSKPLAFIIMTDFVNNEFYCTDEDITNKLNAEINTLFEYKDEVVITDISQIILDICWKYEKSLKNN